MLFHNTQYLDQKNNAGIDDLFIFIIGDWVLNSMGLETFCFPGDPLGRNTVKEKSI